VVLRPVLLQIFFKARLSWLAGGCSCSPGGRGYRYEARRVLSATLRGHADSLGAGSSVTLGSHPLEAFRCALGRTTLRDEIHCCSLSPQFYRRSRWLLTRDSVRLLSHILVDTHRQFKPMVLSVRLFWSLRLSSCDHHLTASIGLPTT